MYFAPAASLNWHCAVPAAGAGVRPTGHARIRMPATPPATTTHSLRGSFPRVHPRRRPSAPTRIWAFTELLAVTGHEGHKLEALGHLNLCTERPDLSRSNASHPLSIAACMRPLSRADTPAPSSAWTRAAPERSLALRDLRSPPNENQTKKVPSQCQRAR